MKLEWIILAEGFGTDAEGSPTAIGLNKNIFYASDFPARTKRGVMVYLTHSDFSKSISCAVTFKVAGPEGELLSSHTQQARFDPPPHFDFPFGVSISAEIELEIPFPGTHEFSVEIKPMSRELDLISASVDLHVIDRGE